eukprot:scaffold47_cov258-Pinguiococcus_pyrenoidosus.AAC.38
MQRPPGSVPDCHRALGAFGNPAGDHWSVITGALTGKNDSPFTRVATRCGEDRQCFSEVPQVPCFRVGSQIEVSPIDGLPVAQGTQSAESHKFDMDPPARRSDDRTPKKAGTSELG